MPCSSDASPRPVLALPPLLATGVQGVWPPCKRESVSLFVPPEASALSEVVDASLGDAHGGLGIAERSLGDADGDLGDPAEYLGDSFVPLAENLWAVGRGGLPLGDWLAPRCELAPGSSPQHCSLTTAPSVCDPQPRLILQG